MQAFWGSLGKSEWAHNKLVETRQEAINVVDKQLKEKHTAQMEVIKLQKETEKLKNEALRLKIKYYNSKLANMNNSVH